MSSVASADLDDCGDGSMGTRGVGGSQNVFSLCGVGISCARFGG